MELFFSPREFCSFSVAGCSAKATFFSFEEQAVPENGGGKGFLRISGEKYCGVLHGPQMRAHFYPRAGTNIILRGKSKGETYFLGRLHGPTTFYDRKGTWISKRIYFLGDFIDRKKNKDKVKYF